MGRPEPYILLAQSFVHSQLDEYMDEVIFAEPVVITGCEFLEQNTSPSTSNVSIIGATSPPSFALEVFVQCEGESRFRRLCQPFLYSHLSSSILEIEAVVTSHLVLRGSYHNLTLIVYGNTAEDLGQFNIELDFDSSVANAVPSPSEDNFEDLPSVLHMSKLTFEESVSRIKSLCFNVPDLDIDSEMKKFLCLVLKILQISNDEIAFHKIIDSIVLAVSSDINSKSDIPEKLDKMYFVAGVEKKCRGQINSIISETRIELLEFYRNKLSGSMDYQSLEDDLLVESDYLVSSKYLIEMLVQCFPDLSKTSSDSLSLSAEKESLILWLGVILVVCSSRDSCFHFINSGGMEQVICLLSPGIKKPTAFLLLLLGVIERATQHVVGCEGFLEWSREDEIIPVQNSDGYCHLLKLLLESDRKDVTFLITHLLHRLRLYEAASRYESALLSMLTIWSDGSQIAKGGVESLLYASSLLKQILKLLEFSGSIDDPSPLTIARKSYLLYQSESLLSYETTASIIESCKYSFGKWDINTNLLFLLKERAFFPLSAALLSSSQLHSAKGIAADVFMEIATSIKYLFLKLLFSRSGLTSLLIQPETTSLLAHSLEDAECMDKSECMSLRQAAVLLLKGFVCTSQEIGMITQLHLRVGIAIDRMLSVDPQSVDFLWVLWELCAISRFNAGRQALLSLCYYPEAVCVMLEALRSFKNLEPPENGSPSLSLAVFHCASEIFEVMVTDSTASSLKSWIEHAVELHKILHLSSPGSNRKDAPTRLLEWIDAGVIYHQNGAVGLLRYGAVLASGGDAHVASTSILISDSVDVENVLGAPSNGSDGQVVDNLLGKLVSDKYFEGMVLRDASITQLTTTFRILAFMSENSSVAASLFEEGALTLIYVVLVNCRLMLERSSNTYDYLLDEGAECNPTSDLLSGRAHEQSLVDLMLPSLILLINLLRKLQETKEQYRNKKLLNALLQLHREVSPRLAGCASDFSYPYPNSALGFGAVCHLIASSLACWPIFNWSPGLFHSLIESVQATSLLSLGPKDACSMFSLLGDLFPEEGIWLWENEMPSVSALRVLSVATIVGPEAEKDINWYQSPEYVSVLVLRLTPQIDRIAQIVLHLASTALVVIQDMLRVFIIRMACQKTECAVVLLRAVVSWMKMSLNQTFSETDIFKVHRLLLFLANLLEHPCAKVLLFEAGALETLEKVLERCTDTCSDVKQLVDSKKIGFLSWSIPAFRCLTSIFSYHISICHSKVPSYAIISNEESRLFARVLKLCQVLPAGRELLACLVTLKELISLIHVCSGASTIFLQIQSSLEGNEPCQQDTNGSFPCDYWERTPPFLICLKKLLGYLESNDSASSFVVETVHALCVCGIYLSKDGESYEGLSLVKSLFGLPSYLNNSPIFDDEKLKCVVELLQRIGKKIKDDNHLISSKGNLFLNMVKDSIEGLLLLLHGSVCTSHPLRDSILWRDSSSHSAIIHSAIITSKLMPSLNEISMDNMSVLSLSNVWDLNEKSEKGGDDFVSSMAGKFVWVCPDTLPERQLLLGLPTKRKPASAEGSAGKRIRENAGSEVLGSNTLARGLSITSISSGPTRRDTFRQRKPNTSRPPSMHVDDYVARERNIDGANIGSNILNSQRAAPSGGRPPSIHVDEFMARQKERQKPMAGTIVNASDTRNSTFENTIGHEKLDRSDQLKDDPDDDLQGIEIVFDENSESDDRLPFPHPDDNIQPAPITIRENSQGSVVEETEGDTAESTRLPHMSIPLASEDRGSNSDLSLRRTVSRDVTIGVSSEKKFIGIVNAKTTFYEHSAESNYASPGSLMRGSDTMHPSNVIGFTSNLFTSAVTTSTVQPSLLPPTNYQRGSPQKSTDAPGVPRSLGRSEEKFLTNQPPLPPMPPPTHLSARSIDQIPSHPSTYLNTHRDVPPSISGHSRQHFDTNGVNITGFHFSSDNLSGDSPLPPLSASQSILDSKISWNMVPSGTFSSTVSTRPLPPLPLTPPPLSAIAQTTQNSSYNQTANIGAQPPLPSTPINSVARLGILPNSGTSITSFPLPPFTPFSNRQSSGPGSNFSSPPQHQGQSSSATPISLPNSLLSLQSIQSRPPPPPPPPPQGLRPLNLPSGPLISQLEHVVPQQSALQVQVQPLQVTQQLNGSQIQFFYQPQQEPSLQSLQPVLEQAQHQQGIALSSDSASQQQQESGITLQQYFSSPEAIQALVRDRDKLCQLLEKHPKLMQMLQERLGQH